MRSSESAAATSASRSAATASASARARSAGARSRAQPWRSSAIVAGLQPALEALDPLAQLAGFVAVAVLDPARRGQALQRRVALPPVDPHLLRPVDRRDEEAQLDRQQLDVEQVDLDVAGDDDALVEDPLEDVGEVGLRLGPPGQR